MTRSEGEPIIVYPSHPIIARPQEAIIAGPAIFYQQELGQRGKNTCFPTSVINASIALGAIRPDQGADAYEAVVQDLMKVPDLWNGANLRISDFGEYLIDLFESDLPIRLGYRQAGHRFITISHTYDQIKNELETPMRHVLVNRGAAHAYATVGRVRNLVTYIDPYEPAKYNSASKEQFDFVFGANQHGYVITTPVQAR